MQRAIITEESKRENPLMNLNLQLHIILKVNSWMLGGVSTLQKKRKKLNSTFIGAYKSRLNNSLSKYIRVKITSICLFYLDALHSERCLFIPTANL